MLGIRNTVFHYSKTWLQSIVTIDLMSEKRMLCVLCCVAGVVTTIDLRSSYIHLKEIDFIFPRFAAVGTAAVAAATLNYLIFHFESTSTQRCFELWYAYEDLVDEVSISVQKLLGCDAWEHPDYHYVVCEGGYTAWKVELLS